MDDRRDPVHPVTTALTAAADLCGRLTALVAAAVDQPVEVPPAWHRSGPVVLIGGVGTTDFGLETMRRWLTGLGYRVAVHTTGIGTGCGAQSVERVRRLIERMDDGDGVAVVAHSRGGQFARAAVAAGAPVNALVTLGTPFDLFRLSRPLLALGFAVGTIGSLGFPGLATLGCLYGPCCGEFRAALRAPVPVPFTSIHTKGDRVVPWRSSLDDGAVNVEVSGGHLGLLDRPEALAAVASALADSVAPFRQLSAVS